jgi:uncharacterized protein YecE (DUF72 family)
MIRVGIGGWTYEPWRGTFYPDDLTQARELEYASRQVTAIEVNGTYYGSQKPASFRKWAAETPDDFVFSLKGPRFTTNRKVLGEAGESVGRFFASGVTELGDKLGPILWQFLPTKRFEPEDFEAFLQLLPHKHEGLAIQHAVEVRHASFVDPAFVRLARKHNVTVVYADSESFPRIADPTGPFIYARLQEASEDEPTGYSPKALDAWAKRARSWEAGARPDDLTPVAPGEAGEARPRPVFIFMINGAMVRAPAAAKALLERLGKDD